LFERYVWEPALANDNTDLEQVATAIQSLRESATSVVTGALHQAIDEAAADAVARHAASVAAPKARAADAATTAGPPSPSRRRSAVRASGSAPDLG
jgi:hypothetical protein